MARSNGSLQRPALRNRLVDAWIGLRIMRYNALRTLSGKAGSGELEGAAMISKLYWASWHRNLGELAMEVMGADGTLLEGEPYQPGRLQNLFLFSRADTIYAGTNQIQRNLISERALGMPREARGQPGKGPSS